MNAPTTLIEYGTPIDSQAMVTPPDVTELELEPGHPGLGDDGYVRRRRELFALCRKHRLDDLGPPIIRYTPEETRIWREVTPLLDELHVKHASQLYLAAKRELVTLIGKAVATTTRGDQVLALKRFSWFSIEFGLIEEAGATKVFGAGILSCVGEIPNSLYSPDVKREPFLTDVVINTDYDPS